MNFETLEVTSFTSLTAAVGFAPIQATTIDAVIVAGWHGKAINGEDRMRIQLFPGLTQLVKQSPKTDQPGYASGD